MFAKRKLSLGYNLILHDISLIYFFQDYGADK